MKPRESQLPFCFGIVSIKKFGNGLKIDQIAYSNSLKYIDVRNLTQTVFAHPRRQVACVANTARPDIAYSSAILAQTKASEATKEDAILLISTLELLQARPDGLIFSKLDFDSIQIREYIDAGFATNKVLTS